MLLLFALPFAFLALPCLRVWLQQRLFLLPYLLAVGYSDRPRELFRASFRGMRGNVWNHIAFMIAASWWIVLLCAVPGIVIGMRGGGFAARHGLEPLQILSPLLAVFAAPYLLFCNVGFASELLPSKRELRRMSGSGK